MLRTWIHGSRGETWRESTDFGGLEGFGERSLFVKARKGKKIEFCTVFCMALRHTL